MTNDSSKASNEYSAPDASSVSKKKRFGCLPVLLIFLGLLVIGIGLLTFVVAPRVKHHARCFDCLKTLQNISNAIREYEADHGHFPPAYVADENGKPMHSWRVLLLPYLEQQALFDRYRMDEPWDGPNNSKLHDEYIWAYRCCSSRGDESYSDYQLVTGLGTGFEADKTIGMEDIPDDLENTIMLVEVFESHRHWMEPVDITVQQLLAPIPEDIRPNHPGIRAVGTFDGGAYAVSTNITPEEMRKLVLIADGEEVDVTRWSAQSRPAQDP